MSSKVRHIKILSRRLEYLKRRQVTKPGFGNAEISALTWALTVLAPEPVTADGEIYQVFPDGREILVFGAQAVTPTPVKLVNDPWANQEDNWRQLDATRPSFWKRIQGLKDSILRDGRDGGM